MLTISVSYTHEENNKKLILKRSGYLERKNTLAELQHLKRLTCQ